MTSNRKAKGFTLIEVMVVVVIIAIIAAVAYPSYQQHLQRTRRAVAAGCMLELSQFMERFYTTNMRYDQDTTTGVPVALPGCSANVGAFYVPGLNPVPTQAQYTIEMVPQGVQALDACGTLTITQAGTRTPDPAARPECWR